MSEVTSGLVRKSLGRQLQEGLDNLRSRGIVSEWGVTHRSDGRIAYDIEYRGEDGHIRCDTYSPGESMRLVEVLSNG